MSNPSEARVVLATLNAKYSHASFGLRYLLANMGSWRAQTRLLEFTINQPLMDIVEGLLAEEPTLIGFGVYIWNVLETTQVIELLRAIRPNIIIVIGGPEVSYEYADTPIFALCDHLITGEADVAFRELLEARFSGQTPPKVIAAPLPQLDQICMPYGEYSAEDLAHRLIYVEASRGCPFKCEFCLSSLDIPVRAFPLEPFLTALQDLLDRGARAFKFVDRTFNLNAKFSAAILEFCLSRYRDGFELHFEMIPDRLPLELRDIVTRFPPGAVQFEVGIQTFTEDVADRISRRQNVARVEENFAFLRAHRGIHIHADLIFGLPGETLESFGTSFDKLAAMTSDEIQIGILKRLRGTPIARHTEEFGLVFSPTAPYEVLQTSTVPFAVMQRMKRFARYFDLFNNKGNFVATMEILMGRAGADAHVGNQEGAFARFLVFSDWIYETTGRTHEMALIRQFRLVFSYLTEVRGGRPEEIAPILFSDYDRFKVRKERPEFLKAYLPSIHPPREATERRWGVVGG